MARTSESPLSISEEFKSLFFDTARFKLIDVESNNDENNVPDNVDIAKGNAGPQSQNALGIASAVNRVPWVPVLIGGGLIFGAWKLLK